MSEAAAVVIALSAVLVVALVLFLVVFLLRSRGVVQIVEVIGSELRLSTGATLTVPPGHGFRAGDIIKMDRP